MTMKPLLARSLCVLFAQGVLMLAAGLAPAPAHAQADRPPNIVLVYADDLGYSDVGCFGAHGYATPNIDRLAAEGVKFTDFYVAQAVCSASRTALLTGCYPNRLGILGALGPDAKIGISDSERTIAQVLKPRGYATAIFGKWHLGHHPRFLPTRHGFDEYFGLPYSNDMWPNHPTNRSFPDLPLIDGEKTAATNPDQRKLTTWYTEHAVRFIASNQDRPFFLYVPHSMPHVPLHVSDKFAGKTERGLFGDVIAELDWSVGQILGALKEHGIDDRTLVLFTSDNGPWLTYGDHGGSARPLREGKGTSFDGGVREPFVARWPGRIPAGTVCREPAMTIDLLPTFAHLAGADVETPSDRPIDGKDITPLLLGTPGARSPHEALYFYWGRELQAVRSGRWKLHLPHKYQALTAGGAGGKPGTSTARSIGLSLFDIESDPGEQTDVASRHPDVVQQLEQLAESARDDLGDTATNRQGKNVRAPGRL
jgi:arylsulfatase A-like enzyme